MKALILVSVLLLSACANQGNRSVAQCQQFRNNTQGQMVSGYYVAPSNMNYIALALSGC